MQKHTEEYKHTNAYKRIMGKNPSGKHERIKKHENNLEKMDKKLLKRIPR